MIRPRKARAIFGGTMAVALIFVVAGAAFACTKFYGALTGSGNGTGNQATTINGNPDAGTFQWCEHPVGFSGTTDAQREASVATSPAFSGWDTKVDRSSGGTNGDGDVTAPSLTVSVAVSDICKQGTTGTNYLPTGTYKVGISEGYWDETVDGFATGDEDNCHTLEGTDDDGIPHDGAVGNGKIIDTTYSVVNGVGSETFTGESAGQLGGEIRNADATGVGGWNTVCVYWPDGVQSLDPGVAYQPANALNFRAVG